MSSMLIPFVGGASAGLIHVLSGPDHLAAIAPLASDSRRRFWTTGALWGLGHSSGVFLVGLAALLFRSWLPIDAVSSWSERLVGVVLIGIGLWGLRRALARPLLTTQVHSHTHAHDGVEHTHFHAHGHAHQGHVHAGHHHAHTHTAFAVGILHGLAGSSHFLGVLPALGLPDMPASIGYLAGYGAGTVAGMTLFASVVGALAVRAHVHGPTATRWLLSACSASAVIVGACWLVL